MKISSGGQSPTFGPLIGSGPTSFSGIPMFSESKKALLFKITKKDFEKAKLLSLNLKKFNMRNVEEMFEEMKTSFKKYYQNLPNSSFNPDKSNLLSKTFCNLQIIEFEEKEIAKERDLFKKEDRINFNKVSETIELIEIWKKCKENKEIEGKKILIEGKAGIGFYFFFLPLFSQSLYTLF